MPRANLPIKLDGTFNTRELGGYPSSFGTNTVSGAFLRSDRLDELSERDNETIYNYGIRLVIDLRSAAETEQKPCALIGYKDIRYVNIELWDFIFSGKAEENTLPSLAKTYIDMLEQNKDKLSLIFKAFADKQTGGIMFNCTGGKDRTGVTAMLLLSIAGVPDEVIIADYSASYHNLEVEFKNLEAEMEKLPFEIPLYILRSDPETMREALDFLRKVYGTAEQYLINAGLSGDEIESIRLKLLGNSHARS